jgi:hypothetical protein
MRELIPGDEAVLDEDLAQLLRLLLHGIPLFVIRLALL